jgi:hypothetical protein
MLKIINSIYDFNQHENAYVIKLSLKKYLHIFNNFDPYPIRKRDIDQNVATFLEDCSNDISFNQKVILEITLTEDSTDSDLEARTTKGLRNYFLYMYQYYKNERRKTVNNSIYYMVFFVLLASLTFWLEYLHLNYNQILIRTVMEGMSIGSWVFLWEAIAGLLLKNRSVITLSRTYKRYLDSKIMFKTS